MYFKFRKLAKSYRAGSDEKEEYYTCLILCFAKAFDQIYRMPIKKCTRMSLTPVNYF